MKELRRLAAWFRKPPMNEDQADVWESKISHIPASVLTEIIDQIIETAKFMPTPGDLKALYGQYRESNRDKFTEREYEYQKCDECEGKGYILAWKLDAAFPYEYAFACGSCENWKRVFPTRGGGVMKVIPPTPRTCFEIIEMGFTLDNPLKTDPSEHGEYMSIQEMADRIGSAR